MGYHNASTGKFGETYAREYYEMRGFHIIATNVRSRFGELDLVIEKGDHMWFVEVKTRYGITKGRPYEAFTPKKSAAMRRAINYYLLVKKRQSKKYSLRVFAIILKSNGAVQEARDYEVQY